jgi:(p)ppGpp synthase/HD superfamily hydrolase
MATLERAIEIAAAAHAGQVDRAGQPYILHPLRVMLALRGGDERMAAVLHDLVEDTPWTLEQLAAEGFPAAVVEAVGLLTHQATDEASYLAYVARLAEHPIARAVKAADLRDNLDETRLPSPTERDRVRLAVYRRALGMLEGSTPGVAAP